MSRERDEILSQVLSLPPSKRREELRRLCGSDGSLLEELRSLLSAYEEDPGFLPFPNAESSGRFSANSPPTKIGRYPILTELGRGGMGVVYKALDPALGRHIAIKVLIDPDGPHIDQIRKEARMLATLNHPNIATVFSFETEDEASFLTMEFVDGESLTDRLRQKTPSDSECAAIARQIALALHASHSVGIEHRDLTPGNVFLDRHGTVKVLDFGLSSRRHANPLTPGLHHTITEISVDPGPIQGTPGFISPEQLRGDSVDHRADIWAFGCILYQCLTGDSLFRRDTLLNTLAATLEQPIDLSTLHGKYSDDLVSILEGCLHRDAGARIDSFGEIATRLDHFSSNPQITPRLVDAQIRPLPRPLSSFVGREADLEAISKEIDTERLVTMTGPGGVGKTRTALEVGHRLGRDFEQSDQGGDIVFVELVHHRTVEAILGEIAQALNLHTSQDLARSIEAALSRRRTLLILDNCEHVLDEIARLVETFLVGCPELRVLATSREALGIAGEILYRLDRLACPDESASEDRKVASLDAVRLFTDRASKAKRDFAVTDENIGAISRICRQLDGLPLALELAAARVAHFSPQEIASRIDDRFQFLTRGSRTTTPHHRTLRMLMDHGFELLDDTERSVFCRLAVFAGGWTLEAAEAVCTDDNIESWQVLDILTRLVDKSLVDATTEFEDLRSRTRYRMLTTVRSYGLDRLREADEYDTTRDRYRQQVVRFAERVVPELRGADQAAWFARLDNERLNLRDAIVSNPEGDEAAARLALALAERYWKTRLDGDPFATGVIKKILAEPSLDPAHRCGLQAQQALLLRGSQPQATEVLARSAVALADEIGEPHLVILAQHSLALVLKKLGRRDEALPIYASVLELCRDSEDRFGESQALSNIGTCYTESDQLEEGRQALESAMAIQRELGDLRGLSVCLHNLAFYHFQNQELDLAVERLDESIEIRIRIRDEVGRAAATIAKASLEVERGKASSAAECLRESLHIRGAIDKGELLQSLRILARLEGLHDRPHSVLELRGAERTLVTSMARTPKIADEAIAAVRESQPELTNDEVTAAITRGEAAPDLVALLFEILSRYELPDAG